MTTKFKVPKTVIADLEARFPTLDTSDLEWSWEVPGKIIEAEFELEGIQHEVEYSISGMLISVETAMEVESLPGAVLNALEEKYPGATVIEAERVEYGNGVVHLELDIEHEDEDFEAHFLEDGKLLLVGEDL